MKRIYLGSTSECEMCGGNVYDKNETLCMKCLKWKEDHKDDDDGN